jgi:ABC-type glycerol-3-phosphate transport system permease component
MRVLRGRSVVGVSVIFLFSLVTVLVVVFPFYWTLVTSVKRASDVFRSPPVFLPASPTFQNYVTVWKASAIPRYLLNTVVVAGSTVAIVLVASSMAAYGVSRYVFRGKLPFLLSLLLAQVMPVTTLIIPLYIFWSRLGLVDGPIALIATYSAISIPVGTWLLLGFVNGIPRQLDEAATIDGASSRTILLRIVGPLLAPGLMATGLSVFIYVWQELMISMTFVRTDRLKPLMAGVSTFITSKGIEWGPLTAAGVLSMIPILIVYFLFRRALIRGLTSGAVKG